MTRILLRWAGLTVALAMAPVLRAAPATTAAALGGPRLR